MGVSASCLAYLFADRFVRRLTPVQRWAGEMAVTCPATGSLVRVADVEVLCVSTALWSLRRSGQARIWVGEDRRPRSPWRAGSFLAGFDGRLDLRLARPSGSDGGRGGSGGLGVLESMLFAALPAELTDALGVFGAVAAGTSSMGPGALVVPAHQEALDNGLLERPRSKNRAGRCVSWSDWSEWSLDPVHLPTLERACTEAQASGAFGGDDPSFFAWLRRECAVALGQVR